MLREPVQGSSTIVWLVRILGSHPSDPGSSPGGGSFAHDSTHLSINTMLPMTWFHIQTPGSTTARVFQSARCCQGPDVVSRHQTVGPSPASASVCKCAMVLLRYLAAVARCWANAVGGHSGVQYVRCGDVKWRRFAAPRSGFHSFI